MLENLLFIAIGVAGLYFGGNFLVGGASKLAAALNVPAAIIGLTVVAFGTSIPELLTNVIAIIRETPDIAIGNVIGSNIANLGLILGVSSALAAQAIRTDGVQREYWIMLGSTLLAYILLVIDGDLSRTDGLILFAGIILYVVRAVYVAGGKRNAAAESPAAASDAQAQQTIRVLLLYIGMGVALLVLGAQLTVDGATGIARSLGISELVIGMTLVAVGTSLPELATVIVAARRKAHDIAVSNMIGSNIFNMLFILGFSGSISPFKVNTDVLIYDGPFMIGITLLLGWRMRDGELARRDGRWLLGAYALFIAFVIVRALVSGTELPV